MIQHIVMFKFLEEAQGRFPAFLDRTLREEYRRIRQQAADMEAVLREEEGT